MAAKILEIIGLEKKYKDRFNKDRFKLDIDYLFLEENKILVVIGPNGAGKSTLIRLINLLEKPDCGSIIFDGVEIYKGGYGRSYQAGVERNYKDSFEDGYTDRTEDCVKDGFKHGWKSHSVKVFSSGFLGKIVNEVEVRRKMAVVFQEPLLFNASVYDNIVMGLKIRGKKIPQVKDRLQYLVERLRISHLLSRSARTLSGGEQQRVSLARALILEPRLLLLDEPLANIDQPSRESLRQDLFGLLRGEKRSTIYVTHDRNEAMMLADWVAVMNGGMVEQLGPKDEIFARPKNEFVAQFVGVETLVEGIVLDSKDNVSVVEIEAKNQNAILDNINDNSRINNSKIFIVGNLRRGSKVTLAIRPEDVVIHSTWAVSKYRVSSGSSSGGRSLDESSLGGDEEVVLEYLEYSLKDSFFKLTSTMNIFSGRISEIKDLGIFKKIEVDCGSFTLASFVTRNSIDRLKLEVGKPVFASVKASSIHFFEK